MNRAFGPLTLLALLAALSSPASAQPELVRCAEGRSVPCFRMRVEITEGQAPGTGDSARWSGAAGAVPFREVDVRTVADAARPLVLLVLFDVSGSMAGEGMQQTRSALRTFLRGLGGSEVAVAPFGSRDVTAGIRGARFGPPAEADAGMDRLPAPAGNTGLYSAVATGAEVLAARLRTPPAGAQGVLLVLTDGRNDVGHPGDEPGLLAGPEGRERAVDAVRRAGVPVWMVGIGNGVDAGELAALAGPMGTPHTVAFDPVRLGRTLGELRGSLASARQVTAVLPADARARLARGEVAVRVEHAVGGMPHTARWRPPLMALPAFAGVASPSRPLATLTAMRDESPAGGTLPVFATLATLLAVLWWIVPPLIWPVPRAAIATPQRRSEAEGDGIRPGVREAPPRRPNDVTAALARRIVVRSG
ncbi:MAG TPA: vWA domain-containing protein [Longimicrobium sp.]|jgi:Mg-chelatase subunit ChlD